MSSFEDLGFFVYSNPEVETQSSNGHYALNDKTERESMRVSALGFCLRIILNEQSLFFKKTTSSVQSALL